MKKYSRAPQFLIVYKELTLKRSFCLVDRFWVQFYFTVFWSDYEDCVLFNFPEITQKITFKMHLLKKITQASFHAPRPHNEQVQNNFLHYFKNQQ